MALSGRSRNAVLDLVAGAATFAAFFLALRWLPDNNAALIFLAAEVAYLLAGTVRGGRGNRDPVLKAILIMLPGAIVILVFAYTGYAFTADSYVFCFFGAAVLGALSGVVLRAVLPNRGYPGVVAVAMVVLVATVIVLRGVVPRMMAASLGREADVPAVTFSLSPMEGGSISSEELRGRVVVLAFWASWCRPCVSELPQVEQVYEQFRSDPRVTFWAVDSGISNDTVGKQRNMILTQHWHLPFATDAENLEHKMNLHGLPKIVLLDPAGRVRWVHDGYDGSEDLPGELRRYIEQLLQR